MEILLDIAIILPNELKLKAGFFIGWSVNHLLSGFLVPDKLKTVAHGGTEPQEACVVMFPSGNKDGFDFPLSTLKLLFSLNRKLIRWNYP